jgi:hypothetical protein
MANKIIPTLIAGLLFFFCIQLVLTGREALAQQQIEPAPDERIYYIEDEDLKKVDYIILKLSSPKVVYAVLIIFALLVVVVAYLIIGAILFYIFLNYFF